MATPLAVPDNISRDSSKAVSFKTLSAGMGDSYSQSAPKGLNPKVDTWDITWKALTLAEKLEVEAFLDSVGEWGLISWTPCYETVEKYFRVEKGKGYTTRRTAGNTVFSLSTKLIEHFDVNL